MHNGNILAPHIIDDDLAHARLAPEVPIPQEEQVAALKGRLHGSREDDDDGRGRVGEDREALPHHEGGREDEAEVEELREGLAWVLEGGEHFVWRSGVGVVVVVLWLWMCGVVCDVVVVVLVVVIVSVRWEPQREGCCSVRHDNCVKSPSYSLNQPIPINPSSSIADLQSLLVVLKSHSPP